MQIPTRRYDDAALGDPARPEGIVVWRTAVPRGAHRLAGVRVTYLMDLLVPPEADPTVARTLVAHVCTSAAEEGSAMVLAMVSPSSQRDAAYRAAGFLGVPARPGWRNPVIVRDDGKAREIASLDDLEVSYGMTDYF